MLRVRALQFVNPSETFLRIEVVDVPYWFIIQIRFWRWSRNALS